MEKTPEAPKLNPLLELLSEEGGIARYVVNPGRYASRFSKEHKQLEDEKRRMLEDSPVVLCDYIDLLLNVLPARLEFIKTTVKAEQIEKLNEAKYAITTLLRLQIIYGQVYEIHPEILDYIEEKRLAFSQYLTRIHVMIQEIKNPLHTPAPATSTPPATDERKNCFNPPMPLDEVRRWFTQLAETNSKNGKPFLTVEQVEQFINRAFVGTLFTEKLSMNEKDGDKGNVVGLFHLYYNHCITHQPGTGKIDKGVGREKYIRLLTDHFDNWGFDEVKNNFRTGGNWSNRP